MKKSTLLILAFLISLASFSQANEKIKYRKLSYNDFKNLSVNDTTSVIVDIFYDKKENAAFGQMSFLPITGLLIIPKKTRAIGILLSAIALPFFLNGSYMLVKYRNKTLHEILTNYKDKQQLPKWIRKKVNKHLEFYEEMKGDY